jgi:signal transduction histidine kinase
MLRVSARVVSDRSAGPRAIFARLKRLRPYASLRARVWTALVVVFIAGAAQTGLNLWGMNAIARMVERSTESRRQLDLFQQLNIEVIRYFHADLETAETPQEIRARIGGLLDQLGASEESEDQLVRHGDGVANEPSEGERAAEIARTTRFLIDRSRDEHSATTDTILMQQIRPQLDRAIGAERLEVIANDRELDSFRRRLDTVGFTSVFGLLLVVIAFSVSVGRAVLGPVRAITDGLRALEQGGLGQRIKVSFHDEFNRIAESINHMAAELKRKQDKLEEINADLEIMVQKRTGELEQAIEDLRRVDGDRKRFFADVSHELRTPLTTIAAEAEVTRMIANGDAGAYRTALETISAQASFMSRRIDDLLAIARSEHGKLVLERGMVDLGALARDAIGDVNGLLKSNQLKARLHPLDAPVAIEGDSRWLRQCVVALLDNAIKFSRPGGLIEVTVTGDGANACLNVRDHGEGVSTANLPRLFERFYQTESGQRQGGTGIGLSIARWIVEQHGGRIAATNEQRGLTMRVILPRAKKP